MGGPLVSVVTPSYNQAEYIEDNILSVKRQSYVNVEHIVIDGESDDGTLDILRSYEDEYDLRWESEPDDGQSDAINIGFGRADGDVIGWLNSDDVYFDVNAFERVIRYFERYNADVIYGDLGYIDATSTVCGLDVRPDFDRNILIYRSLIGQPATFFRREVLAEERLDPSFDFTMDWEFWLRLSKKFEFRHVSDVLAGFRYHGEQKTEDQEAMEREFQRLREKHDLPAGRGTRSLGTDVAWLELRRLLATASRTYCIHGNPPDLAFDGELAPLWRMLAAIMPTRHDIRKSLRRWRGN